MSNHGYYSGQAPQDQHVPTNNPWAEEVSHGTQQQQQHQHQQQHQQQHQHQQHQHQQQQQQQHHQNQYQYQPQAQAPFQPPNQHGAYQPPPGPPPRRTDTFSEERFIPENERGEQREAMEAFEMNRSKPESQTDKDVSQLQQEFPKIDGSLIAALYGDSQSLSGTREMLVELNESEQGR